MEIDTVKIVEAVDKEFFHAKEKLTKSFYVNPVEYARAYGAIDGIKAVRAQLQSLFDKEKTRDR